MMTIRTATDSKTPRAQYVPDDATSEIFVVVVVVVVVAVVVAVVVCTLIANEIYF